jgi:hypothetical protein
MWILILRRRATCQHMQRQIGRLMYPTAPLGREWVSLTDFEVVCNHKDLVRGKNWQALET